MNPVWRPIPGFVGLYEVSSDGHVRNRSGRLLKPGKNIKGYLRVGLSRNGKPTGRSIHSLVAEAFIGPRPEGHHIDHINGDRLDNTPANLRYCTPAENNHFMVRRGQQARGERHGLAKLSDEQVAIILEAKRTGGAEWGRARLARQFGVHQTRVQAVANGRHVKAREILAEMALRTDGGSDD